MPQGPKILPYMLSSLKALITNITINFNEEKAKKTS